MKQLVVFLCGCCLSVERVKKSEFSGLLKVLSFVEMIHLNACLYYFISEMAGLNSDGWVYPGEGITNLLYVATNEKSYCVSCSFVASP